MKNKIKLSGFLLLAFFLTSFTFKKPNILIIGDSISIGYMPYVENHFSGKATIKHNPGNAQHTGTGLEKIDEWVGKEPWDIIQFNWGLWDLCYRHPDSNVQGNRDKIHGTITYSLEEYAANLEAIVIKLKKIAQAKLIFVTTTYVPKDEAGRFKNDPKRYNKLAKRIMKKHSIAVHDIYKSSMKIHQKFGKGSDDVHFTNEGSAKLGELIAAFLTKELSTL